MAVTLNISVTYVALGKASAGPSTITQRQVRSRLLKTIDSIIVPYTVSIPSTVYSVSSYENVLTTAVNTGAFTVKLQAYAQIYNATALYSATSTSVEIGIFQYISNRITISLCPWFYL